MWSYWQLFVYSCLSRLVCVHLLYVSPQTSGSSWQLQPPTNLHLCRQKHTLCSKMYSRYCNAIRSFFRQIKLLIEHFPATHDASSVDSFSLISLSVFTLSVTPALRCSLSFVKTAPCKQQEAAVIAVPLDFTSMEVGRQLWTEGISCSKCEIIYRTFLKCQLRSKPCFWSQNQSAVSIW